MKLKCSEESDVDVACYHKKCVQSYSIICLLSLKSARIMDRSFDHRNLDLHASVLGHVNTQAPRSTPVVVPYATSTQARLCMVTVSVKPKACRAL